MLGVCQSIRDATVQSKVALIWGSKACNEIALFSVHKNILDNSINFP